MKDKKGYRICAYILVYMLIFWMCIFFVGTMDDFRTVGHPSVSAAWNDAYYYGNGRYIGNFLVELLQNYRFINAFVKATSIFCIVLAIPYITDCNNVLTFFTSAALIISIPMVMFCQVYVWSHGFYNYVPPVAMLFVSLAIMKYYAKHNKHGAIISLILALAGFSQQLFSENTTVINLLISVLIVCYLIKDKRPILPSLIYMVFSALGTGVMVLVPRIAGVSSKMGFYRGVPGSLMQMVKNILKNAASLSRVAFFSVAIMLIVSLALYIKLKHGDKKLNSVKNRLFMCLNVLSPIIIALLIMLDVDDLLYETDNNKSLLIGTVIFGTLFVIYIVSFALLAFKAFEKKTLIKAAIPFAVAVISICQLLFIYPIGARCLFVTHTLLCVSAVLLLNNAVCQLNAKEIKKITASMAVYVVAVSLVYIIIYSNIYSVNEVRLEYAQEQIDKGNTYVEIVELPFDECVWVPNEVSVDKHLPYGYTFNQGNIEDMEFSVISYDEYLKSKE